MGIILAAIVVIGILVGSVFAIFFKKEQESSRRRMEDKTDATDRMARLAHHLESTQNRQSSHEA